MDSNIMQDINNLEKVIGPLSNTQKILLATDGSVTTILDVLKGTVNINTLSQEFRPANTQISRELDIEKGELVNYRVVIIGTDEPLIHAISYIPLNRINNNFKEDIIRADIPIGRILKKHQVESRREIKSVDVEEPSADIQSIFNTDSLMLTRTYNIIRQDQILIRIKETFPATLFENER